MHWKLNKKKKKKDSGLGQECLLFTYLAKRHRIHIKQVVSSNNNVILAWSNKLPRHYCTSSSRPNNCFQKVRYCLTPHLLTLHNSPAVISLELSATARFTFPRLSADSQLLFELESAHTHTSKSNKCGHMSSYLSWPSRHCPTDKQHKQRRSFQFETHWLAKEHYWILSVGEFS